MSSGAASVSNEDNFALNTLKNSYFKGNVFQIFPELSIVSSSHNGQQLIIRWIPDIKK